MRKYYLFITRMMLVLSFGLFIGLEANAQDRTVTGTVKDADSGESVPGVNIVIKGTSSGAVTDIDGVDVSSGRAFITSSSSSQSGAETTSVSLTIAHYPAMLADGT